MEESERPWDHVQDILDDAQDEYEIPITHRLGKYMFVAAVSWGAAILAEVAYDKFRDRNNTEERES